VQHNPFWKTRGDEKIPEKSPLPSQLGNRVEKSNCSAAAAKSMALERCWKSRMAQAAVVEGIEES
jgi:hypothetical protein